jgi:hypothetical protein
LETFWYRFELDSVLHVFRPADSICVYDTFFFLIYDAGVEPSPLLPLSFTGLVHQPWMIDGDDCGTVSGMNEW